MYALRNILLMNIIIFLIVFHCRHTTQSTNIPPDIEIPPVTEKDTVFIVDRTGKKWDVTHASNKYGFKPENFQFGLGPNAIRPILTPEFLSPGEPGYFTPDIDEIVIGFQWNEETRAYPISTMSFVEIANDIIVNKPIAVGY